MTRIFNNYEPLIDLKLKLMKFSGLSAFSLVFIIFTCFGCSDNGMNPDAEIADTEAPSVPMNLQAGNVDSSSADLSWDASTDNTGVTGYKVYQDGAEIAELSSTNYTVVDLSSSTTYGFQVSALDAAGNESELSSEVSASTTATGSTTDRVLVFTKTAGFRHGSIPEGRTAIQELGAANDFEVDFSEDSSDFTSNNLSQYDLLIFLNTTGNILNSSQESAFEGYIRSGGAFMGVHSATDTEYDWAFYGELVGAYFANHPNIQNADIEVLTNAHPSTAHLSGIWNRRDEWYNFQQVSNAITPVLNLDESSYSGGSMGNDHPISWYQIYEGARSFYTGMGHTDASYSEPDFRDHLLGGILWCLKRE